MQTDDKCTDGRVVIQTPRGAAFAIEQAAIRAHLTPGELARRLLIGGLRANGFDLAEDVASASGEVMPFVSRSFRAGVSTTRSSRAR